MLCLHWYSRGSATAPPLPIVYQAFGLPLLYVVLALALQGFRYRSTPAYVLSGLQPFVALPLHFLTATPIPANCHTYARYMLPLTVLYATCS